jgi:hypothetical protein
MRGKATLAEPLAIDAGLKLRLRALAGPPKQAAPAADPAREETRNLPPNGEQAIAEQASGDETSGEQASAGDLPLSLSAGRGEASLAEPPAEPLDRHRPAHHWTWRVLAAGFTAEQCRLIRQIDGETLFEHILRAAREGLAVDPAWLLTAEQLGELQALVGDRSPEEIRPLLAHLPADLRFRDVQLYLLTRHGQGR